MSKLFFKDKPVVGLDISQTGIKVMAIDIKSRAVLGYGSLDLDPSKLQNALDSSDNTYLVDNLRALMADKIIGRLPSDHIALSVPTNRTFSRTFSVPKEQESHIADAVTVEVDQYIPIPSDTLYVDHDIIDRTDKELIVNMSAVPRLLVDNCLDAIREVGLTPVFIEPGINATARLLEATENATLTTLILDIGTTSTDIALLDKSAIRISGSVSVGGNTFTIAISEKLGMSLEDAHKLKITNGLMNGPRQSQLKAALDPHIQRIVTEIRKVIRYYSERMDRECKVEQVLIVGGGSDMPAIGDYFTDSLVMPARVASPWQDINFGKLPEPAKQFRPRYISVAGLASVPKDEVLK